MTKKANTIPASGRSTVHRDRARGTRTKKGRAGSALFGVSTAKACTRGDPSPPKTKEDGYRLNSGGLFVRTVAVEPSAIAKGIEKAKKQIQSMIAEFAKIVISDGHKVTEIELSVSFDASGKFLGVGVSGATSIKIKIAPRQ